MVYGVVNSVEEKFVSSLGFTLITPSKQIVSVSKDEEWAVRVIDSMEDEASGNEKKANDDGVYYFISNSGLNPHGIEQSKTYYDRVLPGSSTAFDKDVEEEIYGPEWFSKIDGKWWIVP